MSGKPKWASPVLGPVRQESILERRGIIENDNGIEDGTDPPAFYTAKRWVGKFFPRGCRGQIEEVRIYARNAGVDKILLYWSPQPNLGAIGWVELTITDEWAWQTATIGQMWNYDSLFIWVYYLEAGVDYAYDGEETYDGHETDDEGITWTKMDIRPFIKIIYSGMTPGDVPISGVVNNIPIPSASSASKQWNYPVPKATEIEIIKWEGPGYCDYIEARAAAASDSHSTFIRVYADEVLVMEQQFSNLNALGYTAETPTVSLPAYGVDALCVMLIHKRFEFRREISVRAYNADNAQTISFGLYPTFMG